MTLLKSKIQGNLLWPRLLKIIVMAAIMNKFQSQEAIMHTINNRKHQLMVSNSSRWLQVAKAKVVNIKVKKSAPEENFKLHLLVEIVASIFVEAVLMMEWEVVQRTIELEPKVKMVRLEFRRLKSVLLQAEYKNLHYTNKMLTKCIISTLRISARWVSKKSSKLHGLPNKISTMVWLLVVRKLLKDAVIQETYLIWGMCPAR